MKVKKSKKHGIILGVIIFISLFASMFLAILAFQDIPKYDNPYIFTATVSVFGIVVGSLFWKRIKPIVLMYSLKNKVDGTMSVMVVMIVIGILFFGFNELNIYSAQKTSCDSFYVTNKYRKESGFRRPEVNTLVVDLVKKQETVVCKYNLWLEKEIGDKIELCFYKSILGFNYIEIDE